MNVSCTSCSAKYAIPDEKVRGKKVKITCKHCGTGIIVDGTKIDAQGEVAPPTAAAAPAPVAAPAPAPIAPAPVAAPDPVAPVPAPAATAAAVAEPVPATAEPSFDIAHPDDRQETLPLGALADKYVAGTLTDEAFIWREGMPDWKAPLDIPEVAAAIAARGGRKPKNAAVALGEDEATKIQESPFDGLPADVAGEWREPAKEAPSNPAAAFDLRAPSALPFEKPEPAPSPKAAPAAEKPKAAAERPVALASASAAPKPAAARRSAARGGGDLFGDLAAAGSEDDESLGTDAKEAAPKMTGQRNESSVLFSLDALTKQEPKPTTKKTTPKQDDAALLMGLDSGPSSLANVGTSFGSAFAAPDFNAPVVAPAPEARAADPGGVAPYEKKKGGPGIWIALVAVLVLGGGAAAMVMSGKLASTEAPTPSAPVAAKPAETSLSPAPTPATEPTAVTPTDSVAAAPSAAPATGGAAATTPAMPAAAGGAAAPVAAPKPNEPAAKPAEKPADKPAEKPAEATAAAPFDTNAAKAALGAAAANAGSCKTADGPTGSGKVSVTFMPSGRATNTQVSGDLAGTAVGGCVAKLFRSAKVPAFAGDAVTVTKSFSVQ